MILLNQFVERLRSKHPIKEMEASDVASHSTRILYRLGYQGFGIEVVFFFAQTSFIVYTIIVSKVIKQTY